MFKKISYGLIVAFILILNGCGGSSSSPTRTITTKPTTIQSKVTGAQGVIIKAGGKDYSKDFAACADRCGGQQGIKYMKAGKEGFFCECK